MRDEKGFAPFRINFEGQLEQSFDELISNISINTPLYPELQHVPLHDRKLAIVGGGPSVLNKLDILREWDGDIWSVNRTPEWLAKQGIKSTLISVDASKRFEEWSNPFYVDSAIVSSWCPPTVLERYKNVQIFHMQPFTPHGIQGGSSTASSMIIVSTFQGYKDVTFFGCEGSFEDKDHAYVDEKKPHQIIVSANGQHFRTVPPMLIQCQELSMVMNEAGKIFKEECGGLLRAMIADPNWYLVAVSEALRDYLEVVNDTKGMYDLEYKWTPNEHLSPAS